MVGYIQPERIDGLGLWPTTLGSGRQIIAVTSRVSGMGLGR